MAAVACLGGNSVFVFSASDWTGAPKNKERKKKGDRRVGGRNLDRIGRAGAASLRRRHVLNQLTNPAKLDMQTEQSGPLLSEQSTPSDSLLSSKESSGRRFFLRKAPQKHKSPPQAKPPPPHGAAGGSQPQASLEGSLAREDRMELAAALLQAGERLVGDRDGAERKH